MNKMTSLQEHNNKLTKELDEMRRMLNEKSKKNTFTKEDDLLDSNEESKEDNNQKGKINRGETKFIKHKSGSGAKAKKVIEFNKNLKDIDGQKITSKINTELDSMRLIPFSSKTLQVVFHHTIDNTLKQSDKKWCPGPESNLIVTY